MATLAHMVPLAQPGPVDGAGRKWPQIQAFTLLSEQAAGTGTPGPPQGPGPCTLSYPLCPTDKFEWEQVTMRPLKVGKEKSDAAEGQANKTLGKDGKLSWWSGG